MDLDTSYATATLVVVDWILRSQVRICFFEKLCLTLPFPGHSRNLSSKISIFSLSATKKLQLSHITLRELFGCQFWFVIWNHWIDQSYCMKLQSLVLNQYLFDDVFWGRGLVSVNEWSLNGTFFELTNEVYFIKLALASNQKSIHTKCRKLQRMWHFIKVAKSHKS